MTALARGAFEIISEGVTHFVHELPPASIIIFASGVVIVAFWSLLGIAPSDPEVLP